MPTPKRARPEPVAILRGHASALTATAFLRDAREPARYLLTGDESGNIRLWDLALEETVLEASPPPFATGTPVQSFAQDPGAPAGATLVQWKSGFVRELHLSRNPFAVDARAWHLADAHDRTVATFAAPDDAAVEMPARALCDSFCRAVFLGPAVWAGPTGGGEAAVLRDARTACTFEARLGMQAGAGGKRAGMLMALEPDGATGASLRMLLLAGYEDGSVAVWDLRRAETPVSRTRVGEDAVFALAAHPAGRAATAAGAFGAVVGVADTAGVADVVARAEIRGRGVNALAWGGDGRVVASGGWDGRVRLWEGRRSPGRFLRRIGSLKWHAGSVLCASFEGEVLATGGKDRTVAVWRGLF